MHLLRTVLLALGLALFGAGAEAAPVRTPYVTAELVSARSAIQPGETLLAGLRLSVIPEWHTYWRNPGDSGAETTVAWTLPAGFTAGPIGWPAPEPLPFGPLVNYGYSGETLYPIEIAVPANAPVGAPVTLTADVEWLVCKDICIPETATLSLTLPVAAAGAADPDWAAALEAARAALPRPMEGVAARITPGADGFARLTVAGAPLDAAAAPYFFPFDATAIEHAAPQTPETGAGGLAFTLKTGLSGALGKEPLAGVLTWREGADLRAVEISAEPGPPLPGAGGAPASAAPSAVAAASPAGSGAGLTLLAALGFAVLGGLILNVMPCVFPVLSIKAVGLAAGAHAGHARRHGLLFLAGVLVTFLALGGLLVGLQAAGQAVGWGFQLQEPVVVAGLALLFFLIGLNLLGLFEVAGSLQNAGGDLAAKGGDAGAFFTGALAVLAASPCTAPFMGAALGFTLTQPPAATLAVFAALGLGFAAPMVALSFAPGLQKRLPRPGPWMDRFKQIMAFPMFATTVWLVWVLAAQGGADAVAAVLGLALAASFAVWALRALSAPAWRVGLAAPVLILALLFAGRALLDARPAAASDETREAANTLAASPWSPEAVAAARAEGRTVFVNFTADWCITCKANELTALRAPAVHAAFERADVAYLKADWTVRDSLIAAELARHGRTGVPLYLVYAAGSNGPPRILPQILTAEMVVEAVTTSP